MRAAVALAIVAKGAEALLAGRASAARRRRLESVSGLN